MMCYCNCYRKNTHKFKQKYWHKILKYYTPFSHHYNKKLYKSAKKKLIQAADTYQTCKVLQCRWHDGKCVPRAAFRSNYTILLASDIISPLICEVNLWIRCMRRLTFAKLLCESFKTSMRKLGRYVESLTTVCCGQIVWKIWHFLVIGLSHSNQSVAISRHTLIVVS